METNKGEWTWEVGFGTRKKIVAVGEACKAIF